MRLKRLSVQEGNLHSFNRFAYANNNPVRNLDPDGKMSLQALGFLVLAGIVLIGIAKTHQDNSQRTSTITFGTRDSVIFNESGSEKDSKDTSPNRFPDRDLPRDKHGNPIPDPEAKGPHTQLGQKDGRNGRYDQAREFDANGKPVRDIDFTDHGRPRNHSNPHQHDYIPNPTGGTDQRSKESKPVDGWNYNK